MAQAYSASDRRTDRRTTVEHNPAKFGEVRENPQKGETTRAERARHEQMEVEAILEDGVATGKYTVHSESESTYTVDLTDPDAEVQDKCTCVDSSVNKARCKHQRRVSLEILNGGLIAPGKQAFEYAVNDVVVVDWSEGMDSEDTVVGVVTDIATSGGEVIVGVTDYNSDEFVPGKKYDCAPEWVEPLDPEESADSDDQEETDEDSMSLPEEQKCVMDGCDESAIDPQGAQLCEGCHPEH